MISGDISSSVNKGGPVFLFACLCPAHLRLFTVLVLSLCPRNVEDVVPITVSKLRHCMWVQRIVLPPNTLEWVLPKGMLAFTYNLRACVTYLEVQRLVQRLKWGWRASGVSLRSLFFSSSSCTGLSDFWKLLVTKFLSKVAQIICNFLLCKNSCGYFLGNFWKIWATFLLQLLVTLATVCSTQKLFCYRREGVYVKAS